MIRPKNLKKFLLCVIRLGLCSSSEIMLDYPIDKLAAATTEKCLRFAGVTDNKNGMVTLDQLTRFVNTANTIAIFSKTDQANE